LRKTCCEEKRKVHPSKGQENGIPEGKTGKESLLFFGGGEVKRKGEGGEEKKKSQSS